GLARCAWAGDDAEYRRYHDEEWGTELRGDRPLFEKMSLEGFQAGLSWITILRKRPRFREVFHGFEPSVVAAFGPADVERLLQDAGI
ncbi:DNA-3-methyladenine glycosylase I, partial [Staphylococcus aureus]